MSKSASVAFEDAWQHESIALFTPDGGENLIKNAKNFVKNIFNINKYDVGSMASDRAMFLFCRWLAPVDYLAEEEPEYYLGANGEDGDNSGFGHFVINLLTGEVTKQFNP